MKTDVQPLPAAVRVRKSASTLTRYWGERGLLHLLALMLTFVFAEADKDGYIEPFVWSGIGRARSGCGSAIVGTPEQVLQKIKRYTEMGMRSFIFSGYPHLDECDLFGQHVLPHLETCQLAVEQQRGVDDPITPLSHRSAP